MMFTGITMAFGLVALASGIALLIWAQRNEGKGVSLAKGFGYLISILSILIISITFLMSMFGFLGMKKMMKEGCPMCNMQNQGSNSSDNKSMMKDKGMMQ